MRLRVEDVQGRNCLTNFWVSHGVMPAMPAEVVLKPADPFHAFLIERFRGATGAGGLSQTQASTWRRPGVW